MGNLSATGRDDSKVSNIMQQHQMPSTKTYGAFCLSIVQRLLQWANCRSFFVSLVVINVKLTDLNLVAALFPGVY